MRRLLVAVAVMIMIPVAASAGGGGVDISGCSGFATGESVTMIDSCFDGVAHFAPSETTLTVTNDGQLPHSFTAVDGSFDTGLLDPGEVYEIALAEAGIHQVFCTLHGTASGQGMAGVLLVGEAEPLPVTAPANMSVIKQAVAEETDALSSSVGRLPTAIENLAATQADLIASLEETGSMEPSATLTPTIDGTDLWVYLAVGAALGISLTALVIVMRVRRPDEVVGTTESLEPSLGR